MTIKTNNFEGYSGATDGLAITSGLTVGGGDQISLAGTASRWTLRVNPMHQTYCARVARNSGGSGENPVMLYSLATSQGSFSCYFKVSALPTVDSAFLVFSNSGGFVAYAFLTSTGTVQIKSAGGSVTIGTSPAIVVAGQWYRIDLGVIVGSTTSNGTIRAAVALRDRTTPLWSVTSTAANTGTSALTNVQWGAPVASATTAYSHDFDDVRLDDSTSNLIGAHGYTASGSNFYPDVVLSNTGGYTATGDFLAEMHDASASTYVTSPGTGSNETIEYGFPPITPGSFTISPKGLWVGGANNIRFNLRQGSTPSTPGTLISTRTWSPTNSETTYSYANTGPENAAITDWNDLSMQVVSNAV